MLKKIQVRIGKRWVFKTQVFTQLHAHIHIIYTCVERQASGNSSTSMWRTYLPYPRACNKMSTYLQCLWRWTLIPDKKLGGNKASSCWIRPLWNQYLYEVWHKPGFEYKLMLRHTFASCVDLGMNIKLTIYKIRVLLCHETLSDWAKYIGSKHAIMGACVSLEVRCVSWGVPTFLLTKKLQVDYIAKLCPITGSSYQHLFLEK